MTDTPRKRRAAVPFSEKLAAAKAKVAKARELVSMAEKELAELVSREREKIKLLQDALPPEQKAEPV